MLGMPGKINSAADIFTPSQERVKKCGARFVRALWGAVARPPLWEGGGITKMRSMGCLRSLRERDVPLPPKAVARSPPHSKASRNVPWATQASRSDFFIPSEPPEGRRSQSSGGRSKDLPGARLVKTACTYRVGRSGGPSTSCALSADQRREKWLKPLSLQSPSRVACPDATRLRRTATRPCRTVTRPCRTATRPLSHCDTPLSHCDAPLSHRDTALVALRRALVALRHALVAPRHAPRHTATRPRRTATRPASHCDASARTATPQRRTATPSQGDSDVASVI
jgi:hypothetical protein